MAAVKRLAHVCAGSTDLAATERFYCSGLGCSKVFDFIRAGQVVGFYLQVSEGSFVEVFKRDALDAAASAPISHLCFEVEDIDAMRSRLLSLGYTAQEKKMGADYSWQFWTADPCGVKIEFHQYTEKSCQLTRQNCML